MRTGHWPPRRQAGLSRPGKDGMLVIDEAGFLVSKESKQSKGTRIARGRLSVWRFPPRLSITSLRFVNVLNFLYPGEIPASRKYQRLSKAFLTSARDKIAALFLLMRKNMIRLRKQTSSKHLIPISPWKNKMTVFLLGKKLNPKQDEKNLSHYVLTMEQSQSIFELFSNPKKVV